MEVTYDLCMEGHVSIVYHIKSDTDIPNMGDFWGIL